MSTRQRKKKDEEKCPIDCGIHTMCLALLNENLKSRREFMGKKANKKERPKLAGELRILTQMSCGAKSIANPEGPERDNDLQLPAALFPISDKRKNGMGVKRKRLSRGRR